MNKFALIAAAGIASGASAQVIDIVVDEAAGTITGTASGFPDTNINGGVTNILTVAWDFAGSFSSSDGTTINLSLNPGFSNPILSPNPVTGGQGTDNVSFLGVNATQLLASPAFDNSNPIELATFSFSGSFAGLVGGLNVSTISWSDDVGSGFPNVTLYTPNNINISYVPIPAPATAGLLGLGGLVAVRRRR